MPGKWPANREWQLKWRRDRRAAIRTCIADEKARRGGCIDCGENDPIVLDFDHVRGDKSFNISHAARDAYAIEKVMKEIAKCDLRCANCHRRVTYKRQEWLR